MTDYERRFQRSLHKLIIPTWCTDINSSSKISSTSKQSITSTTPSVPWKTHYREPERTPEIIHVHRPRSYRSCRSSLATSPSPSVHSWHPNHIMDGVNFSLLTPSSSSSRRHHKYEKGIERVSKSSRWYQPTQFLANKPTQNQTGTIKILKSTKHKQPSNKNNHYDIPKIHYKNESLGEKLNQSVTDSNAENIVDTITNDKQQDNHIKSNESQLMPLAITTEPFSHIELIEVTDEDNDDKQSTEHISSTKLVDDHNELLERTANNLVESVLAEILLLKNLDDYIDDDGDKNSGVRELSEDENGLRELDENDMNDTDEFIVFGTKADTSDDEQTSDIPRCNLNRLYTFSKINDNGIDNLKHTISNQNSPRSILEKDVIATEPFEKIFHSSPIYHSNHGKQHIHLEQYIDGKMCPSNSQLSTHQSSEGVNEETARIGRLLLDSIPTTFIENAHNLSQPPMIARSKLKNTRFIVSDQDDYYESPRDDYTRNQRLVIEEYDEELNDKVRRDSAYSSNQERINIHQSPYEPLSECYSGYSFVQSDFLNANISSLQSTTDEAYESEPTTISSSIATTTYVHPGLEHEFEYPSPPPPVPDRRLKPTHLKPTPPPTKPRLTKQNNIDSNGYSIVQKTKPLPSTAIQQLITSTSNDSSSNSTRSMSSRHYCGSIPVSNETTQSSVNSTSIKTNGHSKDKNKEKRNSRTLNCLHPSTKDDDNKRNTITKSSTSSLNKTKIKKQKLITDFDEATNGLAIRLPDAQDLMNKQNLTRTSTSSSVKRGNGMTKNRQTIDNIKSNRLPFYETSV